MTRIHFIQPDGRDQAVEATPGQSVMQAAIGAAVPGIVADCGGACSCATCHGYVDDAWTSRVPPPTDDEAEMIDAGCLDVLPSSRLTCQIKLTADMDGLVIRIPPSQG
ncbi:MAG: (2Fe-2S)-binding protein [Gammaproteobacteria bacterium]|nr:(2Fe-2S)-binding protein [Gammaproteobacteria bacterium]MBU1440349.1 (2Fe-2S)-binding protein [Gammaproteobacteria bacterium]